ncbi:hypothetical protein E2542_SST25871 [Spatholobus suberectus]|nr:hypothetical protein E2542_SST25871 [Spatholobus suberectus]
MANSTSSAGSMNVSSNLCDSSIVCKCGALSKLKISWSDDNPGKRFYGCGNYNGSIGRCDYFIWYNPLTNDFHANLFNKLKKEIKNLKLELEAHKVPSIENFGASSHNNNVLSTFYLKALVTFKMTLKI